MFQYLIFMFFSEEPSNCETLEETEFSAEQSNHQLFDGAIKFSENTVLRSLTATVTLEKLPEFTVKSKRIIDNKNLNSGRKIKSKRGFLLHFLAIIINLNFNIHFQIVAISQVHRLIPNP